MRTSSHIHMFYPPDTYIRFERHVFLSFVLLRVFLPLMPCNCNIIRETATLYRLWLYVTLFAFFYFPVTMSKTNLIAVLLLRAAYMSIFLFLWTNDTQEFDVYDLLPHNGRLFRNLVAYSS